MKYEAVIVSIDYIIMVDEWPSSTQSITSDGGEHVSESRLRGMSDYREEIA